MKISIRRPQWFTEVGGKDNQEDYLWPQPELASENSRIFLLCDGVGGLDSGEIASLVAATSIGTYIKKNFSNESVFTEKNFTDALAYGYEELDKVDTGAARKMGTTMTCLVLHKGGAMIAHIGDSRIYHIRPSLSDRNGRTGIIYQTADHSLVNDLLRAGEITEDEAVAFPRKNVITRAMQPHLERRYKADIYNITDIREGDFFFLCCDGVLEQLTNEKLGEILSNEKLDDEGKISSIKEVCDGKTRDNYTCWLIPISQVIPESTDIKGEEEVIAEVETEVNLTHEYSFVEVIDVDKNNTCFLRKRFQTNLKSIMGIGFLTAVACVVGYHLYEHAMHDRYIATINIEESREEIVGDLCSDTMHIASKVDTACTIKQVERVSRMGKIGSSEIVPIEISKEDSEHISNRDTISQAEYDQHVHG